MLLIFATIEPAQRFLFYLQLFVKNVNLAWRTGFMFFAITDHVWRKIFGLDVEHKCMCLKCTTHWYMCRQVHVV